MKFWTSTFMVSAVIFFFIHTVVLASEDNCPKLDSPRVTAAKYQLFAAYQTGFDGYQAPCDLKCMGKADCANSCQTKQALRLLEAKLVELTQKEAGANHDLPCPSFSLTCLEQCKDHGALCLNACGQTQPPIARQ